MYCSTDPKAITTELARCRRIIACLEPKERHEDDTYLTQGEMDALLTARATITLYADVTDEDGICREYHPIERASDLIDDGIGLRARGGLVYFG